MSVSDDLLKKWLDHVMTNLDWNNIDRRDFERLKRKKDDIPQMNREKSRSDVGSNQKTQSKSEHIELDIPFILPHEFIFLLCNSLNRLANINRLHQPDLSSDLYYVNLQELG